jgi:hypothetical protein
MNTTNNTETDWLTGVTTTTSFRVSMSQRLALPHCTTRLTAYLEDQLGLQRKIPLTLHRWRVPLVLNTLYLALNKTHNTKQNETDLF